MNIKYILEEIIQTHCKMNRSKKLFMKLTIKNLKQVAYLIEIPEESNVSQLKEEIETKHAFDSKSIKLLYPLPKMISGAI